MCVLPLSVVLSVFLFYFDSLCVQSAAVSFTVSVVAAAACFCLVVLFADGSLCSIRSLEEQKKNGDDFMQRFDVDVSAPFECAAYEHTNT